MRVLGISTITNINDPDRPQPASVEEIVAVANRTAPLLKRLLDADQINHAIWALLDPARPFTAFAAATA